MYNQGGIENEVTFQCLAVTAGGAFCKSTKRADCRTGCDAGVGYEGRVSGTGEMENEQSSLLGKLHIAQQVAGGRSSQGPDRQKECIAL